MPQTHRELPPIVATIYGLTDPRDGGLRYVGRTALTVAERLHQHWLVKDRPPTQAYPVSVWLRALAAAGEQPETCIIALAPFALGFSAESYWIARYVREGVPLLNQITDGGRPRLYRDWYRLYFGSDPQPRTR